MGRVQQAQEAQRQAGVAADDRLDLLERHIGAREDGDVVQRAGGRRRDLAPGDDLRLAEEVALKQLVAEGEAVLEHRPVLDLLGQQRDVEGAQQARLLGGVLDAAGQDVDLDDRGEAEQLVGLGAVDEVVQRDREAGGDELPQAGEQLVVEQLVLEQLEDDLAGRQRQRIDIEQEPARDVDPRGHGSRRGC